MLQVTVCVGSSCYVKGSWQVVQALQTAIAAHQLEAQVELKAGFCLNRCQQGVAVQIGEHLVLNVQPDETLEKVFLAHILPEVNQHERAPH